MVDNVREVCGSVRMGEGTHTWNEVLGTRDEVAKTDVRKSTKKRREKVKSVF